MSRPEVHNPTYGASWYASPHSGGRCAVSKTTKQGAFMSKDSGFVTRSRRCRANATEGPQHHLVIAAGRRGAQRLDGVLAAAKEENA